LKSNAKQMKKSFLTATGEAIALTTRSMSAMGDECPAFLKKEDHFRLRFISATSACNLACSVDLMETEKMMLP
jgi:hypothetical protein